jgi:hypothetical protein
MVHSTLARRGAVLTLLATLFSGAAAVTGVTAAAAATCTGKIANISSRNVGIAYYRNNVSYGLLRGATRTGSYANPINAFWIPSPARVEYYNLAGSGEWLATHYPDNQGSYWVNPCHYAKVYVY